MSDIFISYASADRDRAAVVARALQERGWTIWWDRTIPPGRQYDEVIEEALDAARCVVVLWSKASTASSWVKNEASDALSRRALIPAMIDPDVKIPFEFRRLQAADLTRWAGEASTPEFEQFCTAIAGELGQQPRPRPPAPPSPAAPPPWHAPTPAPAAPADGKSGWKKKPAVVIAVVVAVLVGIAVVLGEANPDPAPIVGPVPPVAGLANGSGIHANLNWRDYALAYAGNVSWDGRSSTATISANVFDGATQTSLGGRQLLAAVSWPSAGEVMLSTSVAVAGDSQTPGPHMHNVNLIFRAQPNGAWVFERNCMTPTNCW